jgi:hypothetical protein
MTLITIGARLGSFKNNFKLYEKHKIQEAKRKPINSLGLRPGAS